MGRPAEEADDLWSLCVVLHEMVSGRHPFASDGANEVADRIRRQRPVGGDFVGRAGVRQPLVRLSTRCNAPPATNGSCSCPACPIPACRTSLLVVRSYSALPRSLGRNIKRLRQEAGVRTQTALAELLGVAKSQVNDWENDRYPILGTLTLINIAKGLRCSVDDLLAGVDPHYDWTRRTEVASAEIPIVDEGDAPPGGTSRNDQDNQRNEGEKWVACPGDVRDPGAYGIRIRHDSMIPALRPNTIAIVSPIRPVRDGDEVYAQLASGERLVRLAHAVPSGYVLESYNHSYTMRFVRRQEIRELHVIVYSRRYTD